MPTTSKTSNHFQLMPLALSNRRRWRSLSILVGGCLAVWVAAAQADAPRPIEAHSLAHLVPASSGVFIELLRPRQSEAQFRRANLWTLVQLLSGSQTPFDWRALARRYLGIPPKTALANLFGQRVALAATSWKSLADAVIVVQLRKPELLAPVIAQQRARVIRRRGQVKVYSTTTGLWVATSGRQAAFSLNGDEGSPFDGVVDILAGGETPPLGLDPNFAEDVGRLEAGYMGCLYFTVPEQADGVLAQATDVLAHGAVGMFIRRDRLDLEMQATLHRPRHRKQRPTVDMERIERLPDSTLLAWAASADFPGAFRSITEGELSDQAATYVAFARALVDLDTLEHEVFARIGPRFIVVWDRLRAKASVPQLAVLIESSNAEAVRKTLVDELAALVLTLRRITAGTDRDVPSSPEEVVERRRHMETTIWTVPLTGVLPDMGEGSLTRALLTSVNPSFTTLGGWLVVASSPEYLRQMIDARQGWIPTLGSSNVLRGGRWHSAGEPVVLAAAQPAMASAVVASWEQSNDAASPWAYEKLFGQSSKPDGDASRHTLGIGVRRHQGSAAVVVARVDARGPAAGKLQVNDLIVGVDGKLLSLDGPAADLRRRIAQSANPASMTLRVRRGQDVLDVVVPVAPAETRKPAVATDPANAIRQLQFLGRAMSNAVYAVTQSPPDRFHASVSLRLAPLPSSRQPQSNRQRQPIASDPAGKDR